MIKETIIVSAIAGLLILGCNNDAEAHPMVTTHSHGNAVTHVKTNSHTHEKEVADSKTDKKGEEVKKTSTDIK